MGGAVVLFFFSGTAFDLGFPSGACHQQGGARATASRRNVRVFAESRLRVAEGGVWEGCGGGMMGLVGMRHRGSRRVNEGRDEPGEAAMADCDKPLPVRGRLGNGSRGLGAADAPLRARVVVTSSASDRDPASPARVWEHTVANVRPLAFVSISHSYIDRGTKKKMRYSPQWKRLVTDTK